MDIFYLKLLLAFIVGAFWVTGATMIAEKFGSKVGGVVAGVPSVAVIALFFIGWTQSAAVASQSTSIVPVVMGINALFVVIYIFVSRYNFYLSIISAFLVWFVLSLGLVYFNFDDMGLSLVGFVLLLIFSYLLVEKVFTVPSAGQRQTKRTIAQLLFRSLLSGFIVSFAVLMTKFGGPLLGGAFASFPGIIFSTILITHLTHGREFSLAVIKSLMVSGPLNVVIYAVSIRYLYLSLDIFWGTIVAFLISVASSYLTYLYLNKKMS